MRKFKLTIIAAFLAVAPLICHAAEPQIVFSYIPPETSWSSGDATTTLPQREHPFLFLNKDDFQHLQQRAKSEAWAGRELGQIQKEADAALARPLQIPDMPAEWTHHYVCKTCGIDLEYRHNQSICPRCGRVYTGWPYDGVIAGRHHIRNIEDAATLGLAYQLTSNADYAARARAILTGYAARYTNFPVHDYRGTTMTKGARLFAQTLDEAVHMIPVAWAYDMIYDSPAMTARDRTQIEEGLLRPAALIIRRNDMGVSNWQSWHNAAMAAIGFALNDPDIVDHAVNGKSGIKFQMKHSILPDGFWYEGTASYHFYALEALQDQALAMKAAGMDLYRQPEFRSLYEAPLDYVFPDGTFPAVNDSGAISIQGQADFYEVAYAWYRAQEFGEAASMGGRDSRTAFLFGADELPSGAIQHGKSHIFPGLGAVMLRAGAAGKNPVAAHLDFGPHGGAHGHADKLSLIYFANGRVVMPDPGRLRYAAPLHSQWYKKSLAHNTIIVDGKNQRAAEGKLVTTNFDTPIQLATIACDTAYKDVELTRSIALAPDYMLDLTLGSSPQAHTWDLAYHVFGNPETDLPLKPEKLKQHSDGYEILKNIRSAQVDGAWAIDFNDEADPNKNIILKQADTGASKVVLADGISGEDVTTCPVVLSRKTGKRAAWFTLSVPGNRQTEKLDLECRQTETGWMINVTVAGRTDKYTATPDGVLKSMAAPR